MVPVPVHMLEELHRIRTNFTTCHNDGAFDAVNRLADYWCELCDIAKDERGMKLHRRDIVLEHVQGIRDIVETAVGGREEGPELANNLRLYVSVLRQIVGRQGAQWLLMNNVDRSKLQQAMALAGIKSNAPLDDHDFPDISDF
jgi:hypothetical protein